jgi:probable DNA metabolism protein
VSARDGALQLTVNTFAQWRDQTRTLLQAGVLPSDVDLVDGRGPQRSLAFVPTSARLPPSGRRDGAAVDVPLRVPRRFIEVARRVACHDQPSRWNVLYRVAWRLTHGEPKLLEVVGDRDTHTLNCLSRQVRRDAHKMRAFVRFRRCLLEGNEWFIAWNRPDYRVETIVAPFFRERFAQMCWCILTPHASLSWDRERLHWGDGIERDGAPGADDLEKLWLEYYASTFNPARVNLKAMRAQMPTRHWATLPEARLITALVSRAPQAMAHLLDKGD